MKYRSITTLLFSTTLCRAQESISATTKSEVVTNLLDPQEDDGLLSNKLEHHVFPVLWTFEIEQDLIADDASILAEVEQAFILAANEVHDPNIIQFNNVRINEVIKEIIGEWDPSPGEENSGHSDLVEQDEHNSTNAIGWRYWSRPNPNSVGPAIVPLKYRMRLRRRMWRKKRIWRAGYRSNVSVSCSLCVQRHLADAAMMNPSLPLHLGNEYYMTNAGRAILIRWQHALCKRLKRIKHMSNPDRCFVRIDFDHEESNV